MGKILTFSGITMEELAFTKDTLRALKTHDNFLADLKTKLHTDQQLETEGIDGVLAATNMITRAVAEHKEKNDLIQQLERELEGYRDLEKNYHELDIKYEESIVQKRAILKELDDFKGKNRELESELVSVEGSRVEIKKENSEIQ